MKVTIEEVKANMQDVICRTEVEFGKPVTYVTVRMKNGFTIRESTTCVDPANYDEEIGKNICLEKINDKVWWLLGYALQDKISKEPEDFKERLIVEQETLQSKIDKLIAFTLTESFLKLSGEQQDLLHRQNNFMMGYNSILKERIYLLIEKYSKKP